MVGPAQNVLDRLSVLERNMTEVKSCMTYTEKYLANLEKGLDQLRLDMSAAIKTLDGVIAANKVERQTEIDKAVNEERIEAKGIAADLRQESRERAQTVLEAADEKVKASEKKMNDALKLQKQNLALWISMAATLSGAACFIIGLIISR